MPLVVLLAIFLFGREAEAQYGGGSGAAHDPYLIYTAEQMNAIGLHEEDWDKHFKLMADIDLSNYDGKRGRPSFNIIGSDTGKPYWQFNGTPFTGVFDGNGHTISHLTIMGEGYHGLFGKLESEAEVKDLGVIDVDITGSYNYVGGLVGGNYGRVRRCYSTGVVNGNRRVGGLIGLNRGGVSHCYSTATVGGEQAVGGLVGDNNTDGEVTHCYSTGRVSGVQLVGGLVGWNPGDVTYCFWDTQTSGQDTSDGGTGKTTAQMQTASTFLEAGWDFVDETKNGTKDIWAILEGHDYPRLAWELRAFSPHPQNRATNVTQPTVISWSGTGGAIGHDVYFGEDGDLVANATTESPDIYCGRQPPEMTAYDPGDLEWAKTYYWRIDEVDEADPSRPWKGDVWSFTVADFFILIDDFEDYNDYEPYRIFDIWIDGWGNPINGCSIGLGRYPDPNFSAGGHHVESTIVHGGSQSMPYFFDNNFKYSEAEASIANLAIGQDWTIEGVEVLSLWFYGDAANTAEQMYVALNDIAKVYHDNPDAALIEEWTEWTIDLREFAAKGVNLANVNTISIGFGDKNNLVPGGSGLVFFDDIRLYQHKVIYVDDNATGANGGTSWANAYVYLQDALADANESERPVEIRVAQGTYTPDRGNGYVRGDKQAKFLLKSGVTIKGGFAGVSASDPNAWDHQVYKTVLSGDLSGNDERLLSNFVENSDHVIWCIEGDASAVLDGFTITGGYATDRIGGGLLNYKANPTVKRCVFFDNYASQGGGMANRYSSPMVSECTFSGNLAPHGGGGMYNTDQSHPIVESCVFYDNWTTILGGGGMYSGESNPVVIHCLFIDNVAPFGGGMYNAAANPFIGNCTFSNNRSNSWGGGMQNEAGSDPTVTHCIIWDNIPDGITTFGAFDAAANVTYSDIQRGHVGEGNMNTDPLFANPNGDDYHLKSQAGRWDPVSEMWIVDDVTSPCIDAGDPNSPVAKEPYPNGGIVNMGAYGGTTEASKSPAGLQQAKYGGGTGESNDPYLIYTSKHLNTIGANPDDWDKHFKLMADIDLSAYTGTDFNIIGTRSNPFSGVFDGNGHAISNFIYTSTEVNSIALFGYVDDPNAEIRDLGLLDPNVDAGTDCGGRRLVIRELVD